MIQVTRLDNVPVVVNSDLIETIEATPDTVLSMTTGRKVLVRESVAEVVARVVAFKRAALRVVDDTGRVPLPPAG